MGKNIDANLDKIYIFYSDILPIKIENKNIE